MYFTRMKILKKRFFQFLLIFTSLNTFGQSEELNKLFKTANEFVSQNNYRAALNCMEKAIVLNPEETNAYDFRSYIYSKLGVYDSAAMDTKMLADKFPDKVNYSLNAGWYCILSKDFVNGKKYSLAAIKLLPESYSGYLNVGHACALQKDYTEASYYYHSAGQYLPNKQALDNGPLTDFDLLDSLKMGKLNANGKKIFQHYYNLYKNNSTANQLIDSIYKNVVLESKDVWSKKVLDWKELFIEEDQKYKDKRWVVVRDYMWDVGRKYFWQRNYTIAQTKYFDIIEEINENMHDSLNQMLFYKRMALMTSENVNDKKTPFIYSYKLLNTVKRFHFDDEIYDALILVGDGFKKFNTNDSAMAYYKQCYQLAEAKKNYEKQFDAANNLYILFSSMKKWDSVQFYNNILMQLQPKTKYTLYEVKSNWTRTLKKFEKYQESIATSWECIDLAKKAKLNDKEFCDVYKTIGFSYSYLNKTDSALWYLQQAVLSYEHLMEKEDYSKKFISPLADEYELYSHLQRLLIQKNRLNEWLSISEKIKSSTLYLSLTNQLYPQQLIQLAEEQKKLSADEAVVNFSAYASFDRGSALGFSNNAIVGSMPTMENWKKLVSNYKASSSLTKIMEKLSIFTPTAEGKKAVDNEQAGLVAMYYFASIGKNNKLSTRSTIKKNAMDSLARSTEEEMKMLSKMVYAYYIKPFEKMLQGKKTIYINADGMLNILPVESLMNEEGKYMGELYNIVYIPSLSVNNLLKQRQTASPVSMAAFGNPDYSSFHPEKLENGRGFDLAKIFGFTNWANLPGTEKELELIKTTIPTVAVYQQKNISETNIKKMSSNGQLINVGILHFATHGLGSSSDFNDASLIVSEPDGSIEDGILQFEEIMNLKLKARMVCISACESAIGDFSETGSDDIINLSTAFIIAGANSVVTSSWKISDDATMLFMGEVYKNIYTEKKGISESFFITRKKFIEGAFGEKYKSPYYWAAFRYTGY